MDVAPSSNISETLQKDNLHPLSGNETASNMHYTRANVTKKMPTQVGCKTKKKAQKEISRQCFT